MVVIRCISLNCQECFSIIHSKCDPCNGKAILFKKACHLQKSMLKEHATFSFLSSIHSRQAHSPQGKTNIPNIQGITLSHPAFSSRTSEPPSSRLSASAPPFFSNASSCCQVVFEAIDLAPRIFFFEASGLLSPSFLKGKQTRGAAVQLNVPHGISLRLHPSSRQQFATHRAEYIFSSGHHSTFKGILRKIVPPCSCSLEVLSVVPLAP